ncbi:virion morphogenesis protein [Pseudodesulfovibrio sediminis]|uniref:Virion morphogenesis protein n=1 Tax=Pseudodesulfovibrio sediminis TaxID=2810563 RepID=A0ABM7PA58_9BACT|nr:virion morphogenesis protein [Pseudodesulfovibrio sediminis]BCS89972.1 hypothetical protein PSDVSF_32140 [Pseudodesulfovibrio sediminis]
MPSSNAPLRLKTDPRGRLRLHEQLDILSMSPRTRRNITMRMGRKVAKAAKANIRQQKTIHGTSMEPRKDSRNKRKMLRGFGRHIKPYMRGTDRVEVTFGNDYTARLAGRHQYGIAEPWTTAKAQKIYKRPDYKAPTTRAQAKALKAEGYRLRVQKKRGKGCTLRRVSIKWIMDHLSVGQAGAILRDMRTGTKRGKQQWEVKPAARPFLGPKPGTEKEFLNELARDTMAEITNR